MESKTVRSTNNNYDMLNGSLLDKIVIFALPLAISSILQQLFNAADLAVVGRFASAEAMAAVGSNSSVIALIVSFFVGLSVGANAVIAMEIGSGHKDQISDTVHTVITISLVAGCALIFIGFFLTRPILILMAAPQNVMSLAILYLRIYFFAMPAIMIYNYGSAILRSKGDSRRPLFAMVIAGIINIILNLIFVVGFHMHVVGVALATVLSNMFSAGLILYYLMNEEEPFKLDFRKLSIKRRYLIRMMQIGLPAGLQGAVFSLSNVVIQSAVNSFGADAIAGGTAAANFDFVSYCAMNAFAQSAVTFTSQNYGARKFDRCKKVFRICMLCGIGISAAIVLVLVLFRYQVITLFTTDADVISFAMKRIMNAFVLHFLIGSYEISGGALRGMNHSLAPALISVFGTCVFRLIYVFTYIPTHHTFEQLFRVYPISWIITGTITLTVYFIVRAKEFSN
ncbi:MATE family efflux transporter [Butyrivibrio sp. WCE2006]|uniref:MATE family efflux transporter n=1 Tax=Butyrivibrio sp. WCE2006 TaxID=1410611 RepID=UPI000678DC98|nr:MATE family efflux transporter [Butyrivibrio sp. WCE2006]